MDRPANRLTAGQTHRMSCAIFSEIFCFLGSARSMSAGEIAGHFEMTGATVSYHLSVLKKADLVFETREKNFIYYELNTSVVEEVMLWLSQLKGDNHESHS